MMMNLPVLIAEGRVTCLEKMTMGQLEKFVPFMIKCSVGHNTLAMNVVPEWWPDDVPYFITFKKSTGMTDNKWVKILKKIVCLCYTHHGCGHMLHFCSSISVLPQSSFKLVNGSDDTSSLYNRVSGRLIVTFRNENLTYDKEPDSHQKSLSPSRSTRHQDILLQPPPFEIYLCENCDEEFTALDDIKYHEMVCKQGLHSSHLSSLDGSTFIDLINCDGTCIPQQNFLNYFGLVGGCPMYRCINKTSYTKRSEQKRALENVHLSRFCSIPFASPLGFLLYKHSQSSTILSQIHLDKMEKFCTAKNLQQLSCNRASKFFSGPWLSTWKPKCKDRNGSWAHTYQFYKHRKLSRFLRNVHGLSLRSQFLLKKCKEATVVLERLTDAEMEYYMSRKSKNFRRFDEGFYVHAKSNQGYNEGIDESINNTVSQMEYESYKYYDYPQSKRCHISSDTRLIPNKLYTYDESTKQHIFQPEIPVIDLCTSGDESESQTTENVCVENIISDEVIEFESYQKSAILLPSSHCSSPELMYTTPKTSYNMRNPIVLNCCSDIRSSDCVTLSCSEQPSPQWNTSVAVNNTSNGVSSSCKLTADNTNLKLVNSRHNNSVNSILEPVDYPENQRSTENVAYNIHNSKNIKDLHESNQSASISSTSKSFMLNGGAGTTPVSVFPNERFSKTKFYQDFQNSKSNLNKEFDNASYNIHTDSNSIKKLFPKCNGKYNCDPILNYTSSALDSTATFSVSKCKRNIENKHPKICKKDSQPRKNVPDKLSKELDQLMKDECANIRDKRFFKILKCNHKVLRKREIYVNKTIRTRSSGIPFHPLKPRDSINAFTHTQSCKSYSRVNFHDRVLKSHGKIIETFKGNSSMSHLKRGFKTESDISACTIHMQSESSKNVYDHSDKFRVQKFMSQSSLLQTEPGAKFELKKLNNQCASKSKLNQLHKKLSNGLRRTLKLRNRTICLNSIDKFVCGDSIENSFVKTPTMAMAGLLLEDFVKSTSECKKLNCREVIFPSVTNLKPEGNSIAPYNVKRSHDSAAMNIKLDNCENSKKIDSHYYFTNTTMTLNTQILSFSKEHNLSREKKLGIPCEKLGVNVFASSIVNTCGNNKKKTNCFQEYTHFNSNLKAPTKSNIYKQISCKPSRELKGILKDECKELVNLGLKRCNVPAKTSIKTCTLGSIYQSELREIEVVHRQWIKEANIMCVVNFPLETGMLMVIDSQ